MNKALVATAGLAVAAGATACAAAEFYPVISEFVPVYYIRTYLTIGYLTWIVAYSRVASVGLMHEKTIPQSISI